MLRALPPSASFASLLVGLESPDDAAVVRLTDDLAIVFTTDFFTPIVDDPRAFGRIAAANALSDVYAMGGTPLVALNIAAFPSKTLPLTILGEILAGGAEIAALANIPIAGGHTIDDAEPKYGLAVVGTVHPQRVWRKGGARDGDALVLTKPLGTGVLSTALKRDRIQETHPAIVAAVASMSTLNATAARVAREESFEIHAATDVTGYGLVGHLLEMLRASSASAMLHTTQLPLLEEARTLAAENFLAGGTRANRDAAGSALRVQEGVAPELAWLACDAQTSGGLLFALPEAQANAFVSALHNAGVAHATRIGTVQTSEQTSITLTS